MAKKKKTPDVEETSNKVSKELASNNLDASSAKKRSPRKIRPKEQEIIPKAKSLFDDVIISTQSTKVTNSDVKPKNKQKKKDGTVAGNSDSTVSSAVRLDNINSDKVKKVVSKTGRTSEAELRRPSEADEKPVSHKQRLAKDKKDSCKSDRTDEKSRTKSDVRCSTDTASKPDKTETGNTDKCSVQQAEVRKTKLRPTEQYTQFIKGGVAITGEPKKTRQWDLVEIKIGKEKRRVSPWSIKNKMYHEGLDSHFVLTRVRYPMKVTDEEELRVINKKWNTSYKYWKDASKHPNITEAEIERYSDKWDWYQLFLHQNMNIMSDKFKKKYKQKYLIKTVLGLGD